MEKNIRQRLVLLLIIPFLVSYIINLLITIGFKTGLDILMSIANISLYLWAFVAAFFWFYVGKQFGKLEMPKGKSLVLGNSLWIISLLLYIWQFILLDDLKRNFFIAGISQHYPLGFVWISSRLISLFTICLIALWLQ